MRKLTQTFPPTKFSLPFPPPKPKPKPTPKMPALAFDIYGTLIDTAGVTTALEKHFGENAAAFAEEWRRKQLEYTFRYAAMQTYRDFRICTRQALDYCCDATHAALPEAAREKLMAKYLTLPPFADAEPGLQKLANMRMKMFAFSNGVPEDLQTLLTHANLRAHFRDIVSVHEIQTFKPARAVYQHFAKRAGECIENCWLISSNPFDICGARAAGMRALWLRRNPKAFFDPWEFPPGHTAASIAEAAEFFRAHMA